MTDGIVVRPAGHFGYHIDLHVNETACSGYTTALDDQKHGALELLMSEYIGSGLWSNDLYERYREGCLLVVPMPLVEWEDD